MIENGWKDIIYKETSKDYFKKLKHFLVEQYATKKIYPLKRDIFKCFEYTDFNNVKVVILGQDPYHQIGQAHGLAFSVKKGVRIPPSLRNIYKEMENDVNTKIPNHGDLTSLAKQGVLLLNTIMSVEDSKPLSHKDKGWEIFTDKIIKVLSDDDTPKVFMLWGGNSRSKKSLIDSNKHLVLEASHPSPLSAYNGFFGCRHFSKANKFLKDHGRETINWQIS